MEKVYIVLWIYKCCHEESRYVEGFSRARMMQKDILTKRWRGVPVPSMKLKSGRLSKCISLL